MKNELFALRVKIGGLYVFACFIYVDLDMNGTFGTHGNCRFQLREAFGVTKKKTF